MDSPSTELTQVISACMDEQGAPLSDAQAAALELALKQWKPKRELKAPHVLQSDDTPYTQVLTLTYKRDETTAEHDARMAAMERRGAIAVWSLGDHEDPPPPGTGFHELKDQRIWWVSKDGTPHKIAEMALQHKRNLLAFLERHADALKMKEEWALISGFGADLSDGVADALDQIQDEMNATPTTKWLRKLPLIKALRKSIKADEEQFAKAAR
jgi:hypothetical protein